MYTCMITLQKATVKFVCNVQVTGVGKKLGMSLKSRSTLSNIDVAQLRDMYDCNLKTDTNQTGERDVCVDSRSPHTQ